MIGAAEGSSAGAEVGLSDCVTAGPCARIDCDDCADDPFHRHDVIGADCYYRDLRLLTSLFSIRRIVIAIVIAKSSCQPPAAVPAVSAPIVSTSTNALLVIFSRMNIMYEYRAAIVIRRPTTPPLSGKDHPVMRDALLLCPPPSPLSLDPLSLSMRRRCGNDAQARDGGLAWMDGDDDDGTGRSWSNDERVDDIDWSSHHRCRVEKREEEASG